jgi:hypothetical protein
MDPSTITTSTFTLSQGNTPVVGTVGYAAGSKTATFLPSAPLAAGTVYTATVTTGVRDTNGLALLTNFVWSFTTVAAPTVVSTVPANGATGVGLNAQVKVTFSQNMDPATIDTTTFIVKRGTVAIPGTVTYDVPSRTAVFTPTAPLTQNQTYNATVTTGAKAFTGLGLASDYNFSFNSEQLVAQPQVITSYPTDGSGNITITVRPTVTFISSMDPSTLNNNTVVLRDGTNIIPGTVSYDAVTKTVTFTPDVLLTRSVVYTETVTTGAKDIFGTPLAADFVFSFTTGACGQAPVNLGSAGNFAVLAGSTVTNTGPTSVTGDLGVSAGTAITGFPPGIVIGAQHAGDPTSAQGILDLTTAYNDAAARNRCPTAVSGNLGGQTLIPGLYKSTSSLAISSGTLTLDAQGDSSAVWIFQMASTLDTSPGLGIVLANGANPANIYWQVGTSATINTTSAFYGTIMADQSITLMTGATLNGRALARIGAVTLDSNTVVKQ